jgi:hypothetical protein
MNKEMSRNEYNQTLKEDDVSICDNMDESKGTLC